MLWLAPFCPLKIAPESPKPGSPRLASSWRPTARPSIAPQARSLSEQLSNKETNPDVEKKFEKLKYVLTSTSMTAQEALRFIEDSFNQDDDCAENRCSVSLCDPLSLCRLEFPVRGKDCKHIQCFDLKTHLANNMQPHVPSSKASSLWQCPVCYKPARNVALDPYTNSILVDPANSHADKVLVYANGVYQLITESVQSSSQHSHTFTEREVIVIE